MGGIRMRKVVLWARGSTSTGPYLRRTLVQLALHSAKRKGPKAICIV